MKLNELRNGVCAVIAEKTSSQMVHSSFQAFGLGADLVELRVDFLEEEFFIGEILKNINGPALVTIRRKIDGGLWDKDEQSRIKILQQAQQFGAHAIDVESDCFQNFSKSGECLRVLSYHNFAQTPNDIDVLHKSFEAHRPEIVKVACFANHNSDSVRILDLYRNANLPLIAFCMGTIGFPSRVLALTKKNSPWMYTNFSDNFVNAPGIPVFKDVRSIYDIKSLSHETKVFGVMGDPIGHSLSPAIHNASYKALGYPGVYLPFHISPSDFSSAIEAYEAIPVLGFSVTIPHKEKAFGFATTSSDLVKQIGAANTLVKAGNGFHAENTDATGIIAAIKNKLGDTLDKREALVLGAGGVSRAAVFALKKAGCNVKVCNRSSDRAVKLASDAGVQVVSWDQRHDFKSGLLVNCTSVGMHPYEDDSPWDLNCFTKDHIAFDTVYNPIETCFLRGAEQAGAIVVDGVEMFVCQAAEQFKLFTSFNAPLDVMRKTVLEKLRRNKN